MSQKKHQCAQKVWIGDQILKISHGTYLCHWPDIRKSLFVVEMTLKCLILISYILYAGPL